MEELAGATMVALLIVEYASSPALAPAPGPTSVDAVLSTRPPSVIVELPVLKTPRGFQGSLDAVYMAQGIGHFQKMLNGYSGFTPDSFDQIRETMEAFPDTRSMDFLRNLGVDYVVVRAGLYEPEERAELLHRLGRTDGLSLEAMWLDGPMGAEALYRIRKD